MSRPLGYMSGEVPTDDTAALLAELKPFLKHSIRCPASPIYSKGPDAGECECGLDALLSRLDASK